MANVNIPWQDHASGAKPCPKCGKVDPHYRHNSTYNLRVAVCCGGEGCGFYQAANTHEEALELWNAATADTPKTPVTRKS